MTMKTLLVSSQSEAIKLTKGYIDQGYTEVIFIKRNMLGEVISMTKVVVVSESHIIVIHINDHSGF